MPTPPSGTVFLVVSPNSINFGDVGVGQEADVVINLTARGPNTPPIQCTVFTVSDPDAPVFTIKVQPDINTPTTLTVAFKPTALTSYSATLVINSSNAINAPVSIPLSGMGSASPFLTINPQTTSNFGNVQDGTLSSVLNLLLENNSPVNVTVDDIYFSTVFGPITAASVPGGSSGSSYADGDTGTITGAGLANATYTVLSTTGGAVNTIAINNPGTDYQVGNNYTTTPGGSQPGSGTGLEIDVNTVQTGPFSAGPGGPSTPFTLLANGGSAPVVVPVIFTPQQTGFISSDAILVVSSATNSPTPASMQGTGFLITPTYTVQPGPLIPIFGFNANGTITVLQADEDDLNCEEDANFTRQYDYGKPLMEKRFERMAIRLEDLGNVTWEPTVTTSRQSVTPPAGPVTFTGSNTGLIFNSFADLLNEDDLIQVQIDRAANNGQLSITEMFHKGDLGGEYIENT